MSGKSSARDLVASPDRKETIAVNANIQALRAIAAYGVVIHHIIFSYDHYIGVGRAPVSINIGATGVEIFFVISGYIMSKTTDISGISPSRFIQNRLFRVVPSYWLLTLFAVAIVQTGFTLFGLHDINLEHFLCSLLFLPELDAAGHILRPILFVGWTLEFEMLFYFIFFLTLYLKPIIYRKVSVLFVLSVLMIFGQYSSDAYLRYLFSELLLAFMLGILIHVSEARISLTCFAAFGLMAISVLGLATVDTLPDVTKTSAGHVIVIVAAALLVVSAVGLERRGLTVGRGFLMRQGDASYAIYLIHPFILQFIGKLAIATGIAASNIGLAATTLVMLIASGFGGTIFYRCLDAPFVASMKRRLWNRGSPDGIATKRFVNL
ncbi:acyltransferase [Mesorhizobium sp. M2A.F.Ca.ET.043.05.1.1]|nr:acyltransferase [Mesorhizobium sp. M2A.F.Ca.ET.043.05.1.1]